MKFLTFLLWIFGLGLFSPVLAEVKTSDLSPDALSQKESQLKQQAISANSRQNTSSGDLISDVNSAFDVLDKGMSGVQSLPQDITNPVQDAYNKAQNAKPESISATGGFSLAELSRMTGISEKDLKEFMGTYQTMLENPALDVQNASQTLKKMNLEVENGASEKGAQKISDQTLPNKRVLNNNALQKSIMMKEVLELSKTKDISKEVASAAQQLQKSQGSQSASVSTEKSTTTEQTSVEAKTLSGASSAMIQMLQWSEIDVALLRAVINDFDNDGQSFIDVVQDITTAEQEKLKKDHLLLLAQWASAATNIGAGSNAISHQFFDRLDPFVKAVEKAEGSLGGASTINDTDRLVLFELTRGASLSAVQLGLYGSLILTEVEEK